MNTQDTGKIKAVIVGEGRQPVIFFEDEICEMSDEMKEQIFAVVGESTREDKVLEELNKLSEELIVQSEYSQEQLHQQKIRESQTWKKSNQTHPAFKRR